MSSAFATTPEPPYYVVIFSSQRREGDDGYAEMMQAMLGAVAGVEGFLGAESARSADGFGITTAYFADEAAIGRWRDDARHRVAQERGKMDWYSDYKVRIARVERSYGGPEDR